MYRVPYMSQSTNRSINYSIHRAITLSYTKHHIQFFSCASTGICQDRWPILSTLSFLIWHRSNIIAVIVVIIVIGIIIIIIFIVNIIITITTTTLPFPFSARTVRNPLRKRRPSPKSWPTDHSWRTSRATVMTEFWNWKRAISRAWGFRHGWRRRYRWVLITAG